MGEILQSDYSSGYYYTVQVKLNLVLISSPESVCHNFQETCGNHKWFQITYTCCMHPACVSAVSDLLCHQYHVILT